MCSVDKLMQILAVLKLTHYSSKTVTVKHPVAIEILYFFGYKTEFFFLFHNNSKNLDPYKMDLDFWGCLGRVKLVL